MTTRSNINPLTNSASPQKGFKTRVVYKNADVEDNEGGFKSLYGQSFNRTVNSRGSQKSESRASQTGKLTLADIGAVQRHNSSRSNRQKPLPGDLASPKQSKAPSKKDPKETTQIILTPQPPEKQVKVAPAHVHAPEATVGTNQTMYESQILKEAMQREFKTNPFVNIDDDADYYETVKKLDYCGRCWAAQKKFSTNPFKIKHKGPKQSLYQRDYVEHPLDAQGPVLKNDFYGTFIKNEPMDYGTTMRNDYKAWNVGPVQRETMNFRPAVTGIPFAGKSNYNTEFVDWGANVTAYEKPIVATTIIPELPFMNKTTYRDNFGKPHPTSQLKPLDKDLWKQKSKSPITTGIPFLGESNYAATYKPFKVNPIPNFEESPEYQPTQALPDHLQSLYKKDFGPKPYWKCPAIIFMENNPHPRTRHLYE